MKYKKYDNHLPVHVGLKLVLVARHGATDDFVTLVPGPMKAALLLRTLSVWVRIRERIQHHLPSTCSRILSIILAKPYAKCCMLSFPMFRGEK